MASVTRCLPFCNLHRHLPICPQLLSVITAAISAAAFPTQHADNTASRLLRRHAEVHDSDVCAAPKQRYRFNDHAHLQAEVGEVVLGALLLADFLIGMYVVVLDELVKEWRLVRTKPYQMELDDALALTDEDALAKDMSALRAGRPEGRSYYMEVTCLLTSPLCALDKSWYT